MAYIWVGKNCGKLELLLVHTGYFSLSGKLNPQTITFIDRRSTSEQQQSRKNSVPLIYQHHSLVALSVVVEAFSLVSSFDFQIIWTYPSFLLCQCLMLYLLSLSLLHHHHHHLLLLPPPHLHLNLLHHHCYQIQNQVSIKNI